MADDDRKNITPDAGEEYTHLREQMRSLEDVLVSWKEERDKEEAKKYYEELITKFPSASRSATAKKRLNEMGYEYNPEATKAPEAEAEARSVRTIKGLR